MAHAQRATVGPALRQFVRVDAAVVALTNARVIDGTGAAPREQQTLIIRDGRIAALGSSGSVALPEGAEVIDLTGKSVLPGLVMLHEHLYYPTGPGTYGQLGTSFLRLYLAGGVTTMRTGGNMNGYVDMNLKRGIDSGVVAGPAMDATAPYLNGPLQLRQLRALKGADDARRMVAYWADEGATSFKAYMQISRAELGAAIEEAHKRGLKVTGHLCSSRSPRPLAWASITWSTGSCRPPISCLTSSRMYVHLTRSRRKPSLRSTCAGRRRRGSFASW